MLAEIHARLSSEILQIQESFSIYNENEKLRAITKEVEPMERLLSMIDQKQTYEYLNYVEVRYICT